jgi:hypothetical protein
MIILGVGIGINMPITSTNVQNAVPFEQIGSVTSAIQFFRNIGSTIGSAIYGTIMTSAMNSGFSRLDLSNIPDNVQGMLKNPQIITNADTVNNILQQVPKEYLDPFKAVLQQAKDVLSNSIHAIFLFCMFVSLAGILLTVLFKEVRIKQDRNIDR